MQAANLDDAVALLPYRGSGVGETADSPLCQVPDQPSGNIQARFPPPTSRKQVHVMGEISSDLASFLAITIVQRAPSWGRAINIIVV